MSDEEESCGICSKLIPEKMVKRSQKLKAPSLCSAVKKYSENYSVPLKMENRMCGSCNRVFRRSSKQANDVPFLGNEKIAHPDQKFEFGYTCMPKNNDLKPKIADQENSSTSAKHEGPSTNVSEPEENNQPGTSSSSRTRMVYFPMNLPHGTPNEQSMSLSVPSYEYFEAQCFICKRKKGELLHFSPIAVAQAWCESTVYIPMKNVCCPKHLTLDRKLFNLKSLSNFKAKTNSALLTGGDIASFFNAYADYGNMNVSKMDLLKDFLQQRDGDGWDQFPDY